MNATAQQPRSEPTRTCAGCRREDAKRALLRFAVRDEHPRLVPDVRARLPGRGVSVHPSRACLARAVQKGGFARALRAPVQLDLDELCGLAAGQYLRRVEGLVASSLRARSAAVGTDAVRDALGSGRLELLIVAEDAAGRRQEIEAAAERLGRRAVVLGDKASLGRLAGRAEVGVLGILDGGIAEEVAAMAACAKELGMPSQHEASVGVGAAQRSSAGRKE